MVVPLKPGASLARPGGPVIETARLKLRTWQESDIAPNTAMLADPASGRFITADGKPITDAFVGWRNAADHGRALGAAWLRLCSWSRKSAPANSPEGSGRGFRRAGRASRSAGASPANFAARAMRSRRRGPRSTGSFATFEIDRIIHCIDRENIASQAVARRLGAVIEHEIDLFGHVADLWVTRRDAWQGV